MKDKSPYTSYSISGEANPNNRFAVILMATIAHKKTLSKLKIKTND